MFKKTFDNKHQADLEVFTIYDSKTQSYGDPTFAINHHDLIRQVCNMFADPTQKTNRYLINAEDYSIFRIGTYDRKTGQLLTSQAEHIANMHDLRSISKPRPDTLNGVIQDS